ncbi:MAG: hypothetical protein ACRESR_08215, partial [Gammaproteobacteria bacterium]
MEILAPTSSSSHGGTDSDPVTEFLRTFETEIDTSFVALPNLVDVACALNPDVEASDLLPRQLWEQWQRRHRAALQYVAEKELGKAESTRRAGNPLG